MRRQVVLISPKYDVPPVTEYCAPGHRLLAEQTPGCVERDKAQPAATLWRNPLMAQSAQRRFLPENAMSFGHWFSTSHCSTTCRRLITEKSYRSPARASSHAARPPSSKAIEAETWRAHVRQRDDRIPRQNGTEVLVRLGGRGEVAEVIRFCGLLLGARAQYREYGRPATSRATGAFSPGSWENAVHD